MSGFIGIKLSDLLGSSCDNALSLLLDSIISNSEKLQSEDTLEGHHTNTATDTAATSLSSLRTVSGLLSIKPSDLVGVTCDDALSLLLDSIISNSEKLQSEATPPADRLKIVEGIRIDLIAVLGPKPGMSSRVPMGSKKMQLHTSLASALTPRLLGILSLPADPAQRLSSLGHKPSDSCNSLESLSSELPQPGPELQLHMAAVELLYELVMHYPAYCLAKSLSDYETMAPLHHEVMRHLFQSNDNVDCLIHLAAVTAASQPDVVDVSDDTGSQLCYITTKLLIILAAYVMWSAVGGGPLPDPDRTAHVGTAVAQLLKIAIVPKLRARIVSIRAAPSADSLSLKKQHLHATLHQLHEAAQLAMVCTFSPAIYSSPSLLIGAVDAGVHMLLAESLDVLLKHVHTAFNNPINADDTISVVIRGLGSAMQKLSTLAVQTLGMPTRQDEPQTAGDSGNDVLQAVDQARAELDAESAKLLHQAQELYGQLWNALSSFECPEADSSKITRALRCVLVGHMASRGQRAPLVALAWWKHVQPAVRQLVVPYYITLINSFAAAGKLRPMFDMLAASAAGPATKPSAGDRSRNSDSSGSRSGSEAPAFASPWISLSDQEFELSGSMQDLFHLLQVLPMLPASIPRQQYVAGAAFIFQHLHHRGALDTLVEFPKYIDPGNAPLQRYILLIMVVCHKWGLLSEATIKKMKPLLHATHATNAAILDLDRLQLSTSAGSSKPSSSSDANSNISVSGGGDIGSNAVPFTFKVHSDQRAAQMFASAASFFDALTAGLQEDQQAAMDEGRDGAASQALHCAWCGVTERAPDLIGSLAAVLSSSTRRGSASSQSSQRPKPKQKQKQAPAVKTATALLCCARCRNVYYCSKDCQSQSWKAGHKNVCKKRA